MYPADLMRGQIRLAGRLVRLLIRVDHRLRVRQRRPAQRSIPRQRLHRRQLVELLFEDGEIDVEEAEGVLDILVLRLGEDVVFGLRVGAHAIEHLKQLLLARRDRQREEGARFECLNRLIHLQQVTPDRFADYPHRPTPSMHQRQTAGSLPGSRGGIIANFTAAQTARMRPSPPGVMQLTRLGSDAIVHSFKNRFGPGVSCPNATGRRRSVHGMRL